MQILQIAALIFLIGLLIKGSRDEKKKKTQDYYDRKRELAKASNRNVLKEIGKDMYILHYGQKAYDAIMNDTDTEFFWKWVG